MEVPKCGETVSNERSSTWNFNSFSLSALTSRVFFQQFLHKFQVYFHSANSALLESTSIKKKQNKRTICVRLLHQHEISPSGQSTRERQITFTPIFIKSLWSSALFLLHVPLKYSFCAHGLISPSLPNFKGNIYFGAVPWSLSNQSRVLLLADGTFTTRQRQSMDVHH